MGKTVAGLACYISAALLWGVAAAQPAYRDAPIPVVGVKSGIAKTGQPPPRMNIEMLWWTRDEYWDLYILALSSLQAVNETDPLSYFAISGIHGIPYSAWNGVNNTAGAPDNRGYCPHGEIIFPTWHRPLVALFEQALVAHAVRIAGQYSPNYAPRYKAAAQTLRQPYWDWASRAKLPTAVTQKYVTVKGPHGLEKVRNPLYSYRFQRPSLVEAFNGHLETTRCGGPHGNNATASDESIGRYADELKRQVHAAFIAPDNFEKMASGFENPHNLVHNSAGCEGTIASLSWSAFDPLFMLHHCNVDRFVALWQALYYNKTMFTSSSLSSGQLATPKDTNITAQSPLKPFFNEKIEFWTSDSVANISAFGYTYDDIEDYWSMTPEDLSNAVWSLVNRLYDINSAEQTQRRDTFPPISHPHYQPQQHYYTAEVSVERSEIPLPSTVELILSGSIVGRMSFLAMPNEGIASSSLPLRGLIFGNQTIDAMDPEKAVQFIEQNLTLGIRLINNTLVSVTQAPSLQVEIQAIEYYAPQLNETGFPRFGNATKRPVTVRPSTLY